MGFQVVGLMVVCTSPARATCRRRKPRKAQPALARTGARKPPREDAVGINGLIVVVAVAVVAVAVAVVVVVVVVIVIVIVIVIVVIVAVAVTAFAVASIVRECSRQALVFPFRQYGAATAAAAAGTGYGAGPAESSMRIRQDALGGQDREDLAVPRVG